jgi:predicted nucleic acid-binding Zn ribbon protein
LKEREMNRPKWTLANASEYNRAADSNLGRYVASDPRASNRTARLVSSPATNLLAFAYAKPPLTRNGNKAFAVVRAYAPRGLERATPAQFQTTSEGRLLQLQEQVRHMFASLILRPTVNDPVNPDGYSKNLSFTAKMHFARKGPYGLGPDFTTMRPAWAADVLRAATVLLDAMPWLRYCDVCGALFFKVKRRQVCSRRCGVVRQSRRRWKRLKKGDETERRGRPRTPFSDPIETAHEEWIGIVTQRPSRRSRR